MRRISILFLLAVICSCNRSDSDKNVITVDFDVDNYQAVNLDEMRGIILDGVTVGRVKDMLLVDSSLFIHSSSGLHRFSLETGDLEVTYSRRGSGPEEYVSLWCCNVNDSVVQLYDMNRKRLLEYEEDGSFIRNIELPSSYSDNPFQAFVRVGERYLGKRVYGGDSSIPELAYYDENFRYLEDVLQKLNLRSGLMLHPPFTMNSEGNALYCRYFDNAVYEITQDESAIKYRIDFGQHSFENGDDFKDEYDIIDHVNSVKRKYAVNFSAFQEDERFLTFCYLYDASKRLAVYDKDEDMTFSMFFDSESETVDQICRSGNTLYILTQCDDASAKLYEYELQ